MLGLLKVLDIVPSWVYALALTAALVWGGVESIRGSVARSEARAATTELEATRRAVDTNKSIAAHILAQAINSNLDAETRLKALSTRLETESAKAQKDMAAVVRERSVTQRLQFTAEAGGCGGSGNGAQGQAGGPAKDAGAASTVTLPQRLTERLFGIVGEAESLSIDYKTLYDWANNPKLVCELQP